MNEQAQRIAIAKACGWTLRHATGGFPCGVPPGFIHEENSRQVPAYLADLNAMHEAEEVMTEMQRIDYSNHLYDLARKHQEVTEKWRYLSMTAAQRAEALLRTIGKWEDAK